MRWPGNWVRRMQRLSDHVNARIRAKRKARQGSGKPVGPKLVTGRGLLRRRPKSGIGVLVYLLIAAGLTIVVFKYIVVPLIS